MNQSSSSIECWVQKELLTDSDSWCTIDQNSSASWGRKKDTYIVEIRKICSENILFTGEIRKYSNDCCLVATDEGVFGVGCEGLGLILEPPLQVDTKQFSCLTYNCHFFEGTIAQLKPSMTLFESLRINLLKENLKLCKEDVVCLTEVWNINTRRELVPPGWSFFHDGHNGFLEDPQHKFVGSGLLLMSPHILLNPKFTAFTGGACGSDEYARKGFLSATVYDPLNKSSFNVIVTHTQSEDSKEAKEVRQENIADIVKSPIFKSDIPTIICGDFNIIGGSEEYGQLVTDLKPFTDAWSIKPSDPGYTYGDNNSLAELWGGDDGKKPQRLDYMFTNNTACQSIEVVKWSNDDVKHTYPLSDHEGLKGSFVSSSMFLN
jgi:hypothetical protein